MWRRHTIKACRAVSATQSGTSEPRFSASDDIRESRISFGPSVERSPWVCFCDFQSFWLAVFRTTSDIVQVPS